MARPPELQRFPWHYPPSPRLERRWHIVCRATGGLAALTALLSLAGALGHAARAAEAAQLGAWLHPAAAIAVLLLAIAAMLAPHQPQATKWLAAAALLWSLVALGHVWARQAGAGAARLDPALALLAILALALALPEAARFVAALLALFDLFSGFVTVTRTLTGGTWTPLGSHTSVLGTTAGACLCLLSVAWLAADPHLRPISYWHEATSSGWLMRHVLPLVLVFPLLLTWLQSYAAHPLEAKIIALLLVAGSFVFFLTLLWKASSLLDASDRNRLERQAYASEISDLYDHAPCGYYSLDPGGRIVKINETALRWLGYQQRDIVGRVLFADLLTPASRVAFLRHFPMVQQSNAVQTLELELRREDGSLLPVAISDAGVFGAEGEFLHTRSTLFDVTQRRQTESALRMSEARNRAILASAADAIVTLEESGAIADFNPAAELMFGMRRSEAVQRRGVDLLVRDSPLRMRPLATLAVELEISPTRHLEFTARCSDGTLFPAELTLTRVAGQSPGLFTAFIRDLTEQKRAELELRDSEERLRLLLDSTGEGIFALDLSGNCILCNRAALRLLGYDHADELLGRPIHNLIHHTRPDGRLYPGFECRCSMAARQGKGVEVDDELFFRKDGSSFPVEYRSAPVERNGQPVGAVVTFTDITTRRNLEGQIRQAQKMEAIGRLAAGVAHDFNNLLTVINGYTDLLLETNADAGTQDKLRSVRSAGERAAKLTHQLLAFSRQQILQPRVLDLNAVVRDLEPLLQRTIGEDVELSCQLAAGLPPVKADPSQLDQVLMNLVVNARDAMPNGGRVRVTTAASVFSGATGQAPAGLQPGGYVTLAVSDNGVGMAPETQTHIFEPFFTTKPQGKGTGLGLPTVFGIARQSGGTVTVESAPGRGTTMRVYLPVYAVKPNELPAAHDRTDAVAGRVKETILVAEGEPELRRLMLEVLRAQGYQAMEANHPEAAIEISLLHSEPLHLLITDVVMPDVNGVALAAEIARHRPDLRVLYIAGYADANAAPHPSLKKPFTPEALLRMVRTVLDRPASEAARLASGGSLQA